MRLLLLLISFNWFLAAQAQNDTLIPANPPTGVGGACSATTYGYMQALTGGDRVVVCDPVTHLWTVLGSGGGGSGCSTAGAANGVLVDNGAGGCTTSGVTIDPTAGKAGGISMPQGTANTAGANSVGFQAPASVSSAFYFTLPGAPAAGLLHATNATPSVLSVSAGVSADLNITTTTCSGGGRVSAISSGAVGTCTAASFFCSSPGLGDGLNAIAAGTYLQTNCYNGTGATVTITGIKCFTDNSGTSTLNATNGANTALLTGAVTCSSSFASGTQSATVTIANADFIKFTFVADGTSKQGSWVVTGTY